MILPFLYPMLSNLGFLSGHLDSLRLLMLPYGFLDFHRIPQGSIRFLGFSGFLGFFKFFTILQCSFKFIRGVPNSLAWRMGLKGLQFCYWLNFKQQEAKNKMSKTKTKNVFLSSTHQYVVQIKFSKVEMNNPGA